MMNQITNAVDALIDHFESEWSPSATANIRTMLEQFQLTNDEVALTELIRIDIERRYCSGLTCRLNVYFAQFPVLLEHPERAAEIAYEDYRVRIQLGYPIPPQRYLWIPEITTQRWHQEFLEQESSRPESYVSGRELVSDSVERQADQSTRLLLRQIGFEPVQCIGVGAFSQVFLAQQIDLASRYVVLKVVRQPRGEPQMMAMLQHTNIVPIYSFHLVDSHSIICMPYAGGVTLNDYLLNPTHSESRDGASLIQTIRNDRDDTILSYEEFDSHVASNPNGPRRLRLNDDIATPLQRLRSLNNEQLAVWMFERLAGALAHSHARGVLHGDLKPANVLIRNDGEPALMDFNLSRSLQRSNSETVGGTLAYMSPENLRRMMQGTDSDDARSDIYSLGMMLFELLTGSLPYRRPMSTADTDIDTAYKARQQPLTWPTETFASKSLRNIVQKCLEHAPDRRYESADDLQEDLQRESQNQSLKHAVEPFDSRVRKWVKRHPRSMSAASVTLLATIFILPLAWAAVGWRAASVQAESTAKFNAFVDQSNDALLTMMADPQRYEALAIQKLLLPLESNRLLDQQTIDELVMRDDLDPKSIDDRRSILLRHIIPTAVAECERLLGNKETNGSLETITRLIESAKHVRGPNNSRAVAHLEATLAELNGKPDLAKSIYEQAQSLPFSSDNEYFLEAVRLMADRKWSMARDMLGVLADRNAVPPALRWTSLGRAQLKLGQYEDAKLSLTQSLERAPEASRVWLLRAACWSKLGNLSRAESDIKQAMSLEPSLAMASYNLAMIYLQTDRVQEAIDNLSNALKQNPDQFPLLILRSRAHRRLGNATEADRDLERAMHAPELSVGMLVLRAQTKQKLSHPDFEGALADLQAADAREPSTPSILQKMAYTYVRLGDADKAIEILETVRDLEPDNERAIVYLAVLLARQNKHDQAIAELERALVEPNKPYVIYQAACVHALLPSQKSHVKAIQYLSIAIQRGYGAGVIADDQDLDSLRSMPGYQAILRTTRLGKPPLQDDESPADPIEEFSTSEL